MAPDELTTIDESDSDLSLTNSAEVAVGDAADATEQISKPKAKKSAKTEASAAEIVSALPPVREKKIYQALLSEFIVDDNNRAIQYDKVDEYAKTIVVTGIRKALLCRKITLEDNSVKYLVIDGNHRILAAQKAAKSGHDVGYIKFELDNNSSEESRAFDRIILNTSANMTAFDEAVEFQRLIDKNYTIADISKKCGKTVQHINLILPIAGAPKKVRDMIQRGEISTTLVAQMYAKCKEWDALAEHLATVLDIKKSSNVGGKLATKVTQKDIDTLPIANVPVRVSKYQKRVTTYIAEIKELDLPREERMKKTKVANKLQKLVELLDNDFTKAVAYAEKNFVIS